MSLVALLTILLTAVQTIPRSTDFMDDLQPHRVDLGIGSYSIRRDGLVSRVGTSVPQGHLPLDGHERIYALFALATGNDLLVFYETSNELEGSGNLVRLDGRTLTVKWAAPGPWMNIASPVLCADSICLAGHGSVARIHLDTGRVVWSHHDLYATLRAFNTPTDLVVEKGHLLVHETLASYDHRPAMTLVFDLATGTYATQ